MRDHGVGFLPICDGREIDRTLTDRDISVRAVADGPRPRTDRDICRGRGDLSREEDLVQAEE